MTLLEELSTIFRHAFQAAGLSEEFGCVRGSDRPEIAQFQCNGAMPAAKKAGQNPRECAQKIVDQIPDSNVIDRLEIAGPGFINITVKDQVLDKYLRQRSLPALFEDETVLLDYGGPNIAKPMHVGHLRTGIIGDSLRRMLKAGGCHTYGDVHMGDWGTHIGILLMDYIRRGEDQLIYETNLSDQAAVQLLFNDMADRYPRASAEAKADEALMEEARQATLRLQNEENPYFIMWEKIRKVSIASMEENYGRLNVGFDLWKGESDVHALIEPMAVRLAEKGYAIQDQGAQVVPVAQNDDKKEIPPLILYKRDGAVMYGTTDMATIVERVQNLDPDRMIYIVDQRQSLHFEQVFRAVRKSGIVRDGVELTLAGVGTMNGADGKPFKTRAGGVMRLDDVIDMTRTKALERLNEAELAQDMNEQERLRIAEMIGVAALKFADLQNQRHQDYIFDLERMTHFEGKTGPYLLYQAVRIKSLLRKAGDFTVPENIELEELSRPLALLLVQLPEVYKLSVRNYAPHTLCEYVFQLAQEFSSFYGSCHILSEENDQIRTSRLALCVYTLETLQTCVDMLGIELPERM